jgi:hypothetical protein
MLNLIGMTMARNNNLKPKDRIRYSDQFLRNNSLSCATPNRTGTFVSYDFGWYARVHWDDVEEHIKAGNGRFADPDYCDYVRCSGSLVHVNNITKTDLEP